MESMQNYNVWHKKKVTLKAIIIQKDKKTKYYIKHFLNAETIFPKGGKTTQAD